MKKNKQEINSNNQKLLQLSQKLTKCAEKEAASSRIVIESSDDEMHSVKASNNDPVGQGSLTDSPGENLHTVQVKIKNERPILKAVANISPQVEVTTKTSVYLSQNEVDVICQIRSFLFQNGINKNVTDNLIIKMVLRKCKIDAEIVNLYHELKAEEKNRRNVARLN